MSRVLSVLSGARHLYENVLIRPTEMLVYGGWVDTAGQNRAQKVTEMEIESAADAMVVELFEHEIARELEALGGVHPSTLDADGRLAGARRRKDAESVDQAMVIEVTIRYTSVMGVAK
jgi:hypothetical protein